MTKSQLRQLIKEEILKEYDNQGPSEPKVYLIKNNKLEVSSLKHISNISNLTYDMGGGETSYYDDKKEIVVIDNIKVETFLESFRGKEGFYIEYNLNKPFNFPKAKKIIVSQLVYHLDDLPSLAKTINGTLRGEGELHFFSDLMNKMDKTFLKDLENEYGFGLPKNLNKFKSTVLILKRGEYENVNKVDYLEVEDNKNRKGIIKITKEGNWFKYEKVEGNIPNFKPLKWSTSSEDAESWTITYDALLGNENALKDYHEDKVENFVVASKLIKT
tara:strand:- start:263 stop:1081 length:819 start_codon:yes stop_codon:yes gene_type:complete